MAGFQHAQPPEWQVQAFKLEREAVRRLVQRTTSLRVGLVGNQWEKLQHRAGRWDDSDVVPYVTKGWYQAEK